MVALVIIEAVRARQGFAIGHSDPAGGAKTYIVRVTIASGTNLPHGLL